MTAYSAIADSEIDPESAYTTTLATKMRDNPIAITEGASGAPSIARIARSDPGRLVYISKATLSATASASFINLGVSAYDSYYFMIKGLYASAAANDLVMQTSINNGSSYDATNYRYHTINTTSSAATYAAVAGNTQTTIILAKTLQTTLANSLDGIYEIKNIQASRNFRVNGEYTVYGASGGVMFGGRQATETVNAVKFFASAAATLTGEIIMYGIDSGA